MINIFEPRASVPVVSISMFLQGSMTMLNGPEAMFEPRPTPPMQSFANVFLAHPGVFGKPIAPVETHLAQAVLPNVQMSSSANKPIEKVSPANNLYISDEPSDTEVGSVCATSGSVSRVSSAVKNNMDISDEASDTEAGSVSATSDSVSRVSSAAFIDTADIKSDTTNTIKAVETNRGERKAKAQKWRSTIMPPLKGVTPAVVFNVLATPTIVQAKFSLMQTRQIIDRN